MSAEHTTTKYNPARIQRHLGRLWAYFAKTESAQPRCVGMACGLQAASPSTASHKSSET